MLVLGAAAFWYVHCAVPTLDLASINFPFDEDKGELKDIPPEIRQLDGQEVAAEGYMIPMDQAEQIHQFALVPDLSYIAGGSAGPPLKRVIVVNSSKALAYNAEKIRVFGRLHVRLTKDENFIVSIYDMDAEQLTTIPADPIAKWPWFVIGAIPAVGVLIVCRRGLVRRRLRRAGCCSNCGYDLRATPGRCPECGVIPSRVGG